MHKEDENREVTTAFGKMQVKSFVTITQEQR